MKKRPVATTGTKVFGEVQMIKDRILVVGLILISLFVGLNLVASDSGLAATPRPTPTNIVSILPTPSSAKELDQIIYLPLIFKGF